MDSQQLELLRRRRQIQEAEGYLELAMVFDRMWESDLELRSTLVRKSVDCLNQVNQTNSRLAELTYLTGCALKVDGKYEAAIESLEAAVAYDDQLLDAYLALGYCFKRTGKLVRAIEAMEEALKVDPVHAIVHYNIACYFSLAGNIQAAVAHLSRSVQLNPKLVSLIKDEKDFDSIRRDRTFVQFLKTIRLDRPVTV